MTPGTVERDKQMVPIWLRGKFRPLLNETAKAAYTAYKLALSAAIFGPGLRFFYGRFD